MQGTNEVFTSLYLSLTPVRVIWPAAPQGWGCPVPGKRRVGPGLSDQLQSVGGLLGRGGRRDLLVGLGAMKDREVLQGGREGVVPTPVQVVCS